MRVLASLSLRTQIALLAAGLVLLSVAAGTVTLLFSTRVAVERELGRRALHIARTMAEIDEVKDYVAREGGDRVIQPIAERVRIANDVEYVVVLDMQRHRLSHPVLARIGTRFEGGDEGPAFAQETYTSAARGIAGDSIRAFTPIMVDDQQVGVVVVGLMLPPFSAIWADVQWRIVGLVLVATAVGLVGALLLGGRIRRQLLGLEPREIAERLQERVAILNALGEGLIAIDARERITVINREAQRILGVGREVIGRPVREVIPNTRLPHTMEVGEPEFNQEMLLGGTVVMTNRVPVRSRGQVIGAVSTFRDRSEISRLAEQLTGVTTFVESLRAQNHEHMNKLHTIAGLIQFRQYDRALDYIFSATEQQQELTRFLARRFGDYHVAGLLLGKVYRARELGVELTIDRKSRLRRLGPPLDGSAVVVMLGNLLENALDAASQAPPGRQQVYCSVLDDADGIRFVVHDGGPGIPTGAGDLIWQPGFSTKGAPHSGLGLALVRQHVDAASGSIAMKSGPTGTTFEVWLPPGPEEGQAETALATEV